MCSCGNPECDRFRVVQLDGIPTLVCHREASSSLFGLRWNVQNIVRIRQYLPPDLRHAHTHLRFIFVSTNLRWQFWPRRSCVTGFSSQISGSIVQNPTVRLTPVTPILLVSTAMRSGVATNSGTTWRVAVTGVIERLILMRLRSGNHVSSGGVWRTDYKLRHECIPFGVRKYRARYFTDIELATSISHRPRRPTEHL